MCVCLCVSADPLINEKQAGQAGYSALTESSPMMVVEVHEQVEYEAGGRGYHQLTDNGDSSLQLAVFT